MKVLTILDYFYPGIRSGGPAKSLHTLINALSPDINFYIITRNHDLNMRDPYPNILCNHWISRFNSRILYSNFIFNPFLLISSLNTIRPDCIYLNSFFSPTTFFTLFAYRLFRVLRIVHYSRIIISPRGELTRNSLRLKAFKKLLYIFFLSLFRLVSDVKWHFTSFDEFDDFQQLSFPCTHFKVTPNLVIKPSSNLSSVNHGDLHHSNVNPLKIVNLSRIVPKKNLLFLIEILRKIKVPVELFVYGPVEDENYWMTCQHSVSKLPPNISFFYSGLVDPMSSLSIFSNFDVFVFPSLSENFGHVIFESLSVGTPVITSIFTPWPSNESGSLISLPLSDPDLWVSSILTFYNDSPSLKLAKRHAAFRFSDEYYNNHHNVDDYFSLFGG